jgi:hypothetical protein
MANLNRRTFLQVSAASYLLRPGKFDSAPGAQASISAAGKSVRVKGTHYAWEWAQENDGFRLLDKRGLVISSGKLQPAVLVQAGEQTEARKCVAGKPVGSETKGNTVTIAYEGVNGSARLSITCRFDDDGLWMEDVDYETPGSENIVALHYFAEGSGDSARPTLENFYLLLPGISESSGISPIVTSDMDVHLTSWLGRGSSPAPGLLQQWGLPAHYFCGLHRNKGGAMKSSMTKFLSEAFCCGLAELPSGDLFLETSGGRHSLIVSYRSDIWKHLHGPGRLPLGARLYWAVGPNYSEAIRAYYRGLMRAGVIERKTNSPKKNAVLLAPQFNCWGAEVAAEKAGPDLDEAALNTFYRDLKASGMKARMFVVDDKWEGKWGNLEHSAKRLPHFEEFRRQVRSDGLYFGLWAAFMRCEDPAHLGLNVSHMLHHADGKPLLSGGGRYYILDFTQPEVAEVLRVRAKKFVERYQPDLVKFDFGYELPPLSVSAPTDMSLAGERLMLKGLEVVVNGMREVNPDLVVMYYSLSPLFTQYFDLHSPDDLFMAAGEYDLEANRRFFFSSLLGEVGMPTYGSGGYDWVTMPEIWFDSALIGTLGSLNSFTGDEQDSMPTPERIAKYNGLAQALRASNTFSIEPVDADYFGAARGCHSSSWARFEDGELVALALRAHRIDGGKGSGKFREVAQTTASVVVASKTREGIARATKLAVVPYGEGELTIKREVEASASASMTEHYFGGGSKARSLTVENGHLRVPLRERSEGGSVVEWIELDL